ncbi:MAG: hypothetical protein OXD33_12955 [Rhodobacteraceae bacterium]|nr:hypothetical protein [Paracoccaceae bacterium]MCY4327172.1 hypothetical protein [Paracoccaceae bacterium]
MAKQHATEAINMHEHAGLEKTDRSPPIISAIEPVVTEWSFLEYGDCSEGNPSSWK